MFFAKRFSSDFSKPTSVLSNCLIEIETGTFFVRSALLTRH